MAATTATATMTMSEEDAARVARVNASFGKTPSANPVVSWMNGRVVGVDRAARAVVMDFDPPAQASNGTVVQGGVSAAMLDAAVAYAVLLLSSFESTMTSLDQTCTYLEPVKVGSSVRATARIVKWGKSVAFCEAELTPRAGSSSNTNVNPLVRATQTCMLLPGPAAKQQPKQHPKQQPKL